MSTPKPGVWRITLLSIHYLLRRETVIEKASGISISNCRDAHDKPNCRTAFE